jgi:hypothetical protein
MHFSSNPINATYLSHLIFFGFIILIMSCISKLHHGLQTNRERCKGGTGLKAYAFKLMMMMMMMMFTEEGLL